MTTLNLALLGNVIIDLDGQPSVKFKTKRAQALLLYLAGETDGGNRFHRREALMELLWPGMPPKSARRSLRQTLYYLRQAIVDLPGENTDEPVPFLLTDRASVQLNPDYPLELDITQFRQALNGASSEWPAAAALYRGDFLADFYLPDTNTFEEWVAARRADYRRSILGLLDELTNDRLARERYSEAEDYALRQLRIDNLREGAYQQLMQALALDGRQAEALSAYHECVQVLEQELAVTPGEATTTLYEAIQEGRLTPTIQTAVATPRVVALTDALPPSPYRGLFAFREQDAHLYFGREAMTERLVEQVGRQSIVAVIGPSGSGKSSLLHAGLSARLSETGEWLVASFRPGAQPFRALAAALLPLLEDKMSETETLIETNRLSQALKDGQLSLGDVVLRIQQKHQDKRRLLFLVDQFEELYAQGLDVDIRQRFVDLLLELIEGQINRARTGFCLAIALRADFLDQALGYRPLADVLQGSTLMLSPMSQKELGRAIRKPAEIQDVSFEQGLVERILADIGQEPGNLPLLEFSLERLWLKQVDRQLTHSAYEDTGRVGEALARYADSIYDGLSVEEQLQARTVFLQLVQPGLQAADTRRQANREELGDENWAMVQHLADARLVVVDRDPAGIEIVELVHETLIDSWGCLKTWLQEDYSFRVWQERMRVTLQQWLASGRDEGALLRGALLVEAESWQAEKDGQFSQLEHDYINSSRALRDRRERLRRYTMIGLATGLLLAILLATIAVWQGRSARQARLVAEEERDQTQLTLAQLLASQAQLLLDKQLDLSLLVALEALKKDDTPQTRGALLAAVSHNPDLRAYLYGHDDQVRAVTFSPDGKTLASASFDRKIQLWDMKTGRAEGPPLISHTDNVQSLAFTPDGSLLASGSFDDTIILWDVANRRPLLEPLVGHTGDVLSLAFSPDGGILASGSADGTIRFWDPQSGQQIGDPIDAHSSPVSSIAFSPDGVLLATAGGDDNTYLWDVTAINTWAGSSPDKPVVTAIIPPLKGHSGLHRSVAFSPDYRVLAMDGDDNTIVLWDISAISAVIASGDIPKIEDEVPIEPLGQPISGHQDWLTSLAFSNDGHQLASADRSGRLLLWDISDVDKPVVDGTGYESQTLSEDGSTIWDLAYSPDGHYLAEADGSGRIALWDTASHHPLASRIEGPGGRVTSVALNPEGTELAVGDGDRRVSLFDVDYNSSAFGKLLHQTSDVHAGAVWVIAYSPDGSVLASSGQDDTVLFWDSRNLTSAPFDPILNPVVEVGYVEFSPDGDMIAIYGDDTVGRVWEVSSGDLIQELDRDYQPTNHEPEIVSNSKVETIPKENFLANFNRSGIVIWDWMKIRESDEPGFIPFPERGVEDKYGEAYKVGAIRSAALSPDGRILAIGTLNVGIILLDTSTGQVMVAPLYLHQGDIAGLAFTPDGRTLLSIGVDGQVIFWDVNPESESFGLNYGPPLDGQALGNIAAVSFDENGSRLATRHTDGSITIWRLDVESQQIMACERAGRNMTQTEWRQFFGEEPYRATCPEFESHLADTD